MSKKLNTEDLGKAISRLKKTYGGSTMDKLKDDLHKEWMSQLGHSGLFTTPDDPTAFIQRMIEGIVPEQRAHVYTMIFGYANFLINYCSSVLAGKDAEIIFRNEFIIQNGLNSKFMEEYIEAFPQELQNETNTKES